MPTRSPASISVTRSIVVRVSGELSTSSANTLKRMLHDLIVDQGLADVMVDLSGATGIDDVTDVLDEASSWMASIGGCLELRLPADVPRSVVESVSDVPAFMPVAEPGSR